VIQFTITPAFLAAIAPVILALATLVWAIRKDPKNPGK
jgi:hypothetical protein